MKKMTAASAMELNINGIVQQGNNSLVRQAHGCSVCTKGKFGRRASTHIINLQGRQWIGDK